MTQTPTYSPEVFNVANIAEAKAIILTTESDDATTDQRWERETPYLIDLMAGLKLTPESFVLDYGCGIGRLSKGLIERYGCRVVGVDISQNMRTLASNYVASDRFTACSPGMISASGMQFDAAIAVWVLQHCFKPEEDIARIKSAMKPGAGLFVVNAHLRVVPTAMGWVDDGGDVRGILETEFRRVTSGLLDPAVVSRTVSDHGYWARFASPS
jgi:cyclopropane fatty-acyl-phospholipid synthase-like methyltransferase